MDSKIKALIEKILKQIVLVKQRDAFLFYPPRVHEPAISNKLAVYLQAIFPKHDVDIEYDKYGADGRKELENFKNVCTANNTDRVRPDIIVHQRGVRTGNLLVLEIKDCKAPKAARICVDEKLKRLTDRKGQFGYALGILWLFGERKPIIEDANEFFFYVNGECYDDLDSVIKILGKYEIECQRRFSRVKEIVNVLKESYRFEVEARETDALVYQEPTDRQEESSYDDDKIFFYNETEEEEEEDDDMYIAIERQNQQMELEKQQEAEMATEQYEAMEDAMYKAYEAEQRYKQEQYKEGALRDYREGILYDKDFYYISLGKDDSAETGWKNAWQDLYFLSTNSLFFNHLRCVKMQKRLLDIALEYDHYLNIFSCDEEDSGEKTAEEHRKFLTAWLQDRALSKLFSPT